LVGRFNIAQLDRGREGFKNLQGALGVSKGELPHQGHRKKGPAPGDFDVPKQERAREKKKKADPNWTKRRPA